MSKIGEIYIRQGDLKSAKPHLLKIKADSQYYLKYLDILQRYGL